LILYIRIEETRAKTLLGMYGDYATGEKKIKRMQDKLLKMGYSPDGKIRLAFN